MPDPIHLGLIGDNIAMSQSPRLHQFADQLSAQTVTCDRLVRRELGKTFEELLDYYARSEYRSVNITYPYKERVVSKVDIEDELVRAIGAVNTVVFKNGQALGFNTDYSGFCTAHRGTCGGMPPGPTFLVGAGGVGRAIAFGLVAPGVGEIRITDRDPLMAEALAATLRAARPGLRPAVSTETDSVALARGVEGVVNGTPVGMVGDAGTLLPRTAMAGARWAFDAVYTPVDTMFLWDAAAEGLKVITGYKLFIGQEVDAWKIFTGIAVDSRWIRAALKQPDNP
jgi:shikimate dehydrogenase